MACFLCGLESESTDHLFLNCCWSWKLWKRCMKWWEVSSCHNSKLPEWSKGWQGLCLSANSRRVWSSLFSALVWKIWETRNKFLFENKEIYLGLAEDTVKSRTAWWFKHLGKGSEIPVTSLMLNVNDLCVDPPNISKLTSKA
ncbi:hypothetical protein Ddye_025388 [Dipteronia dyeriana]|uniref:Reverse transcriptase zinc-binding domain-containing protein n=1 Tax=Dipteronia dyeriana TaxID=168575 RepID=A0AAD9TWN3_9ROSI|nr:hypothetical protein Ddye_025388 [Dipteronia dyeriana]